MADAVNNRIEVTKEEFMELISKKLCIGIPRENQKWESGEYLATCAGNDYYLK